MSDTADTPERPPWYGTARPSGPNGNHVPGGGFAKGNKAGSGNPNAKRAYELKQALLNCGSVEAVQELYQVLMTAAKNGDIQAAKLLLDHLVGRPSQTIEVSGTDGDPIKADMTTLTAVLLSSLDAFPEARYAAARALRGMNQPAAPAIEASTEGPANGHGD